MNNELELIQNNDFRNHGIPLELQIQNHDFTFMPTAQDGLKNHLSLAMILSFSVGEVPINIF